LLLRVVVQILREQGWAGPVVTVDEALPQLTGAALLGAVLVVFAVVAVLVAPRSKQPSSALAWILVITFLPFLGLLLFLLIGSPKLPQRRREQQRGVNSLFTERSRRLGELAMRPGVTGWLLEVARLNRAVGAMPLIEGNSGRLFTDFDTQLDRLVQAADRARLFVHVEFFILSYDDQTARFFAALGRAVDRGVTVRVLVDHLGSRGYPGYRRACDELDQMGASWHLMLPVQPLKGRYQRPDLRNHRKLVVVDGDVGFVGSLNLIDPSYQRPRNLRRGLQWRDLLVEVRGPVVRAVDAVFITDWHSETDELLADLPDQVGPARSDGDLLAQVAPSGPGFDTENNLALFNSLIYYASRRLSITSPYFVPDQSLLTAITTAARRGVAVELFVGEIGDQHLVFHAQHSYYAELLEAGVRIYLYPAPSILHAKHISVDDDVALVGSSNLDMRSFQLDLELMLMVCGRTFVDDLRTVEDAYRSVSHELTAQEWSRRTRRHRLVDDLARLTSAIQ
jgi:cardiolipin synthase